MTPLDLIICMLIAQLPTIAVGVFLLLHQRQRINADLETQRVQALHCMEMQKIERERMETIAAVTGGFVRELGRKLASLLVDDETEGEAESGPPAG